MCVFVKVIFKKIFVDSEYTIYDKGTPLELRGVGCLASSNSAMGLP